MQPRRQITEQCSNTHKLKYDLHDKVRTCTKRTDSNNCHSKRPDIPKLSNTRCLVIASSLSLHNGSCYIFNFLEMQGT
eukprot:3345768-Amphidinium_carterae.1